MANFDLLSSIVASIGFFIIVTFITAICYDIVKKVSKTCKMANKDRFDSEEDGDKTSIDIRIMIYVVLFLILLQMSFITYNMTSSSNHSHCWIVTYISFFLFSIWRSIMYSMYIRRIQVIYRDTAFAVSSIHIYLFYGFITLYCCFPVITFATGHHILDFTYDSYWALPIASVREPFNYFIITTVDLFIAIYHLRLFVYPLWKLVTLQKDKGVSTKLYCVMIKYSILYTSSIISNILFTALTYFVPIGYNYSMIDGFINGMILIFLHPIHNTIYKSVCCCFHNCCLYVLDAPEDNKPEWKDIASNSIKGKPRSTVINDNIKKQSRPNQSIAKQHIQLQKQTNSSETDDVSIHIGEMMKHTAHNKENSHKTGIQSPSPKARAPQQSNAIKPAVAKSQLPLPTFSIFSIPEEKEEEEKPMSITMRQLEINPSFSDEPHLFKTGSMYDQDQYGNDIGLQMVLEDLVMDELEDSPLSRTKSGAIRKRESINISLVKSSAVIIGNIESLKRSCSDLEIEETLKFIRYESTCL